MSPTTKKIIGELGLRYRPGTSADIEAHAAGIALLALDVADVPPHLLRRAVDQWVRTSKFMPKASELIDLARRMLDQEPGQSERSLAALVESMNSQRWVRDSGCLFYINRDASPPFIDRQQHGGAAPSTYRRADPLARAELDKLHNGSTLSASLVSLGLTKGWLTYDDRGLLVEVGT